MDVFGFFVQIKAPKFVRKNWCLVRIIVVSWSSHGLFLKTPRARLQATVLIQTFGQIFEAAVQKGPLTFCLDSADATTHGERDVTLPPMLPPSEGFAGFIPPLFQSYSGLLFPIFHVPSGSIRFHQVPSILIIIFVRLPHYLCRNFPQVPQVSPPRWDASWEKASVSQLVPWGLNHGGSNESKPERLPSGYD